MLAFSRCAGQSSVVRVLSRRGAVLAVTVLLAVSLAGASSATAAGLLWSRVLHASKWINTSSRDKCQIGEAVPRLVGTRSLAPTTRPAFIGPVGWRIWWAPNGTGFPIVSHNRGATWYFAGTYIEGTWAGGSMYTTSHLMMMSSKEVFAWGSNSMDFTINGGRTWFNVLVPEGQVASVGVVVLRGVVKDLQMVVDTYHGATNPSSAIYRPTSVNLRKRRLVETGRVIVSPR